MNSKLETKPDYSNNNIFKATNGAHLLKPLFLEQSYTDQSRVIYTLNYEDHPKGYPSLYRLYLELEDVTEYEFAKTYLDGMPHWRKLCKCSWFKPLLEEMRGDLQLKLQSRAIRGIAQEAASEESRNKFSALKYLADKGYVNTKDEKAKRGRPSKEEIEQEKKQILSEDTELNEILQRLN